MRLLACHPSSRCSGAGPKGLLPARMVIHGLVALRVSGRFWPIAVGPMCADPSVWKAKLVRRLEREANAQRTEESTARFAPVLNHWGRGSSDTRIGPRRFLAGLGPKHTNLRWSGNAQADVVTVDADDDDFDVISDTNSLPTTAD